MAKTPDETHIDKNLSRANAALSDLMARKGVIDDVDDLLSKQLAKLKAQVPEEEVDPDYEKPGFVAYGSFAASVIARKNNLRQTQRDIAQQSQSLEAEIGATQRVIDGLEREKRS